MIKIEKNLLVKIIILYMSFTKLRKIFEDDFMWCKHKVGSRNFGLNIHGHDYSHGSIGRYVKSF